MNWGIRQHHKIKKEIEEALECKISEYFKKDFYVPNEELPEYLEKLRQEGKLSREDIKKAGFRNKDLGECKLLTVVKASLR